MKCPHCEYEHGYGWTACEDSTFQHTEGKQGDFYTHPVRLERGDDFYIKKTKTLYGCPACDKTFIGE